MAILNLQHESARPSKHHILLVGRGQIWIGEHVTMCSSATYALLRFLAFWILGDESI